MAADVPVPFCRKPKEYECFTHDYMLKAKVVCAMLEDEARPYHAYLFVISAQVKVTTLLGFLSSPVFMGCWTEAQKKKTRVRIKLNGTTKQESACRQKEKWHISQ